MAVYCGWMISRTLSVACQQYSVIGARCSALSVANIRLFSSDKTLPKPPKKPSNTYMLFIQDKRQAFKTQNPGLSNTELIKKLSIAYTELSAGDKERYKHEFERNKEQYDKEMAQFKNGLTAEDSEKLIDVKRTQKKRNTLRKKRKLEKTMEKPRRPLNPFLCFASTKQDERASRSFKEFSAFLGNIWKNMSQHEKQVFIDMAAEQKDVHDKALAEWESQMIDSGHIQLVRKSHLPKELQPVKPKKKKSMRRKAKPKRSAKSKLSKKTKNSKMPSTTGQFLF